MKKCKKIWIAMMMAVLCFLVIPEKEAKAETTYALSISGTECNSMAFQVLEKINAERAKGNVGALKMDSNLMEAAMQRAHELAVSYSHNRPNQAYDSSSTNWYTAISNYANEKVYENIAVGQSTATAAVNSWVNSEGHYNNLMQAGAVSTGVGVFYHEGYTYWVQIFSEKAASKVVSTYTNASETKARTVEITVSNLSAAINRNDLYGVKESYSSYDFLPYGKTITFRVRMTNLNTEKCSSCYCQFTQDSFSWSSSNSSIIAVDSSGTLTGKGCGTVTICAKINNVRTIPFQLSCYKDINEATIQGVYSLYPYTGSAIEPDSESEFSITYNGTALKKGTDYTVTYENNISISNTGAVMYIEGMGDYAGSVKKTFTIKHLNGKEDGIITVEEREKSENESEEDYVNSVVIIKIADRTLVNKTDYWIRNVNYTSEENSTTGKAYFSFYVQYSAGCGNGFKNYQSMDAYQINAIADQTYTGNPITPAFTFSSLGGYSTWLTEGTHYTVSYQNNVNEGTATITVTGTGKNYFGSISRTFNIVKSKTTGSTENTGNTGTTTKASYSVTFNANNGSCATKSKTYTAGSTLSTLPTAARKGYTFKGWYTSKSGGSKVGTTTTVDRNMTLYARWSKVSVGKAKISSLTVGKKKVTVKFKKVSGAKGYQIRYATKSNMKSAKTVTVTSLKKIISKLTKGKRYYFQVRAYKKDSTGAKVYGAWSTKKRCKKVK